MRRVGSLITFSAAMAVCILVSGLANMNCSFVAGRSGKNPAAAHRDWDVYNGTPGNTHYSSLKQINRQNDTKLQEAGRYDTGETGGLQTNPLVINGVVYAFTPTHKVLALDARTGELQWKFDSGVQGDSPARGLASWTDGKHRRLIVGIMNYVYAPDSRTGRPITGFGDGGRIDIRESLGRDPESVDIAITSPPAVYKDLFIVGGA